MKRYLILENGSVWEGEAFGAEKEVFAEIVFTTAVSGYTEILTDPSHTDQAVVQTFPLTGNYGVILEDKENKKVRASAFIVRQWCEHPSNFRCEQTIDAFLKENNVPGLCGIDTRALTKLIREEGTMNGMITDDPSKADIEKIKAFKSEKPAYSVMPEKPQFFETENARFTVAMLDFGKKEYVLSSVLNSGCNVWVLPGNTAPDEVLKLNPDGIFLTNGPGNPEDYPEIIENIKILIDKKIPMMGICLGHELIALAHGFSAYKMKHGHRGQSQPVRDLFTGNVYISTQNHGYAISTESIDKSVAAEFFTNVNDGTCEGLIYNNKPIFSVQFHPISCGAPKDTGFLFNKFIELMGGELNALK